MSDGHKSADEPGELLRGDLTDRAEESEKQAS